MKDHIIFDLYECLGFNNKSDMANAISAILSHDIVLATRQSIAPKQFQRSQYFGNVEEYVNERCQEIALIDEASIPIEDRHGPYRLWGNGLVKDLGDPSHWQPLSFTFDMWGKEFNHVMGSLISTENNLDMHAKLFLRIAQSIYQVLHPTFGIVDYEFTGMGDPFEDIPARRIPKLYWATFFGPAFINKYGKEFFLNAPTWSKSELLDGGVLIQLSDNLKPPKEQVSLDNVEKYFSRIGVEYVSWPHYE